METGDLPDYGLCNCLDSEELELFKPDDASEFYPRNYWAYGGPHASINTVSTQFSPLRQTIVLFLAAMNDEL